MLYTELYHLPACVLSASYFLPPFPIPVLPVLGLCLGSPTFFWVFLLPIPPPVSYHHHLFSTAAHLQWFTGFTFYILPTTTFWTGLFLHCRYTFTTKSHRLFPTTTTACTLPHTHFPPPPHTHPAVTILSHYSYYTHTCTTLLGWTYTVLLHTALPFCFACHCRCLPFSIILHLFVFLHLHCFVFHFCICFSFYTHLHFSFFRQWDLISDVSLVSLFLSLSPII